MNDQNPDSEFILTILFLRENGAAMNVAQIKKFRNEAATQVFEILKNLGTEEVPIDLVLE